MSLDLKTELFTKVSSEKDKDMDMECKLGQMEPDTKVNGLITKRMVEEYSIMWTEIYLTETGHLTKQTVLELTTM